MDRLLLHLIYISVTIKDFRLGILYIVKTKKNLPLNTWAGFFFTVILKRFKKIPKGKAKGDYDDYEIFYKKKQNA